MGRRWKFWYRIFCFILNLHNLKPTQAKFGVSWLTAKPSNSRLLLSILPAAINSNGGCRTGSDVSFSTPSERSLHWHHSRTLSARGKSTFQAILYLQIIEWITKSVKLKWKDRAIGDNPGNIHFPEFQAVKNINMSSDLRQVLIRFGCYSDFKGKGTISLMDVLYCICCCHLRMALRHGIHPFYEVHVFFI